MTGVTPSPTCRAPHVALRFSPDGRVHACCVNSHYQLGRIGERTISEIWNGEELARLRDSLDGADYSLGCQDCSVLVSAGQRVQTHAEQFDRYPQPTVGAPAWPRRLEFALSNTCNLQCVQCNGELSSSIRTQREHRPPLRSPYGEAFFAELAAYLPHVEVAVFIGGEPFLSRECRAVWDLLIEMDLHPEVHVTTNGTVWDDRVEHYLHALEMNVAVSLDSVSAEVNDAIRVGSDFGEVMANRDRFLAATRSYGSVFGLNHCLMTENWQELGAFLLDADALGVDAHVIPVIYPPRLSLFCLPPDELAPVLAGLEAQASDLAPRLDRNLSAWESTLSHLRLRLDGRDREGTPVVLARHATVGRDDAQAERLRGELMAWSGGEPLTFDVEDGVVRSVGGLASWTSPLAPGDWPGRPAPAILDELRARLGPLVDLRMEAEPGLNRGSCRVATSDREMDLQLVVLDWYVGLARWSRTMVAAR